MNAPTPTTQQNHSLLGGLALILIGGIFMLRNFDVIYIGHNWWALFFLIPISYSLSAAFTRRRENGGTFPAEARGSLIGAAVLALVMCIFLFNLNWGAMWPVFLILGGIAVIFGARSQSDEKNNPAKV